MPAPEHGSVHVWQSALDLARADQFADVISSDEQRRAASFRSEEDAARFVVGRGTLREVLGRYLSAEPGSLRFAYGARGKPFLQNKIEFNLSHSGDLLLIAVANEQVGVDVELVRPDLVDDAMEDYVLAPDERALLEHAPREAQIDAFFRALTYKEAYAKALGIGMQLPLKQLSVLPLLTDGPTVQLPDTAPGADGTRWRLDGLDVGSGYRAALASEGHDLTLCCWNWEP